MISSFCWWSYVPVPQIKAAHVPFRFAFTSDGSRRTSVPLPSVRRMMVTWGNTCGAILAPSEMTHQTSHCCQNLSAAVQWKPRTSKTKSFSKKRRRSDFKTDSHNESPRQNLHIKNNHTFHCHNKVTQNQCLIQNKRVWDEKKAGKSKWDEEFHHSELLKLKLWIQNEFERYFNSSQTLFWPLPFCPFGFTVSLWSSVGGEEDFLACHPPLPPPDLPVGLILGSTQLL